MEVWSQEGEDAATSGTEWDVGSVFLFSVIASSALSREKRCPRNIAPLANVC
jgi:hypothetical protein